eukprot:TRINITY_DN9950_c0_g1_i1.p1 TRINITY_DN9950_c0_g1~~TRINITY_DN9950_c0_g1_i1.p1  ORF type:complete len:383 (-),score=67.71 TRINITY_DN9950_c0_g1_i1:178-1281(-)
MLSTARLFARPVAQARITNIWVSSRQGLYSTSATPVELVKELRQRTAAGYNDCKKALQSSNNDIDAAISWLRQKGALKAAAKADRVAAEGLVGAAVSEGQDLGVLVEVNSESDFVARADTFQELVREITVATLSSAVKSRGAAGVQHLEADVLNTLPTPSGKSVGDLVTEAISKLQENLKLRRASIVSVQPGQGIVSQYLHSEVSLPAGGASVGKIGSLVALKSQGFAKQEPVNDIAKKIAMQVVGYSPSYTFRSEVPESVIEAHKKDFEKEHQELVDAPKSKEEEQLAKRKFSKEKVFEEIVLTEQEFLGGAQKGKSVSQVLQDFAKKEGGQAEILTFTRMKVGDGIVKRADNFADEVSRVIQSVT